MLKYKISFLTFTFLVLLFLGASLASGESLSSQAQHAVDSGAPSLVYPESYGGGKGGDHRLLIWILIQQHFYLGSFILGTPMIAWLLELFAFVRRKSDQDQIGWDMMQIALPFYPVTAITGLVLLSGFLILYPKFFEYLAGLFRPVFYLYALAFFLESLLFYGYTYTWPHLREKRKMLHLGLGGLTCLNGVAVISLANALMAFMMSPRGVDAQGRFQGDLWAIVNTPFWNPLNVHRILASMMFSGCLIAAFSAFSMRTATNTAERAYLDQMGHQAILIAIGNLCLLPFAGYWFAKEIFIFRQRMGMTLMGGSLSWLFIVQALLLGLIFITFLYYLWQGTVRMEGSERYQRAIKYLLIVLFLSFLIWTTPHTLPATQGEFQTMGGTQHPIVGYYGTMSAKNTAINTMIVALGLCLMLLNRCNRIITVSWRRWGNAALILMFTLAEGYIVFLGVYGIILPAHVRVALAFPQFLTAMGTLIGGYLINGLMLRNATVIGPIQWGKLSSSGRRALFILAFLITTTMALMGYIRSSVRLNWHIVEIMKDVTPWASTLPFFTGLRIVLFNVVLFFFISYGIFRVTTRPRVLRRFDDVSFKTSSISVRDA